MLSSLQEVWQSRGCSHTIFEASSPRSPKIAPWDPSVSWNCLDTRGTFLARYGFYNEALRGDGNDPSQNGIDKSLLSAGNLVGERGSIDQLQRFASSLATVVQPYVVTVQDFQDSILVKDPFAAAPVWDTVVRPSLSALPGTGAPPPAPPRPPAPPTQAPPISGPPDPAVSAAKFRSILLNNWGTLRPVVEEMIALYRKLSQ